MSVKVSSKVTSDFKQFSLLVQRLNSLDKYEGQYGYFAGDIHKSSGLPIADLADMLNSGTSQIPARPFVDDAINSMERWMQVNRTWKNEVWDFLCKGGGVSKLYQKYANIGANTIRAMIDVNTYEDNNLAWAAMKQEKYGSFKIPLTETDELYNAAKGKVVKR